MKSKLKGLTGAILKVSPDGKYIIKNNLELDGNNFEQNLYNFFKEKGFPVAETELKSDGLYIEKLPKTLKESLREKGIKKEDTMQAVDWLMRVSELASNFDIELSRQHSPKKPKLEDDPLNIFSEIKFSEQYQGAFNTINKYVFQARKEFPITGSDGHFDNWGLKDSDGKLKAIRIDFNNKRETSMLEQGIKLAESFIPMFTEDKDEPIYCGKTKYGRTSDMLEDTKTIIEMKYSANILGYLSTINSELDSIKQNTNSKSAKKYAQQFKLMKKIIRPARNIKSALNSIKEAQMELESENVNETELYLSIRKVEHYAALSNIRTDEIKSELPNNEYRLIKKLIKNEITQKLDNLKVLSSYYISSN